MRFYRASILDIVDEAYFSHGIIAARGEKLYAENNWNKDLYTEWYARNIFAKLFNTGTNTGSYMINLTEDSVSENGENKCILPKGTTYVYGGKNNNILYVSDCIDNWIYDMINHRECTATNICRYETAIKEYSIVDYFTDDNVQYIFKHDTLPKNVTDVLDYVTIGKFMETCEDRDLQTMYSAGMTNNALFDAALFRAVCLKEGI